MSLAQVGEIQQSWLEFEPEGSVVFVGFSSHSMQQHFFQAENISLCPCLAARTFLPGHVVTGGRLCPLPDTTMTPC